MLRFVKGIFIGSGFVLPGVSGGALAAVFGIYERIMSFLAHITKNFKKNVLYMLPVGLGGLAGVFLFSFVVSFFMEQFEAQIRWMFVGCICGMLPALKEQAERKGSAPRHTVILGVAFALSLFLLFFGERLFHGQVPQNFGTWVLAGGLIGLGVIVPGLSPSNFLVYMGMYKAMTDGIKDLDWMVILPLMLGGVATVLLLSKVMDYAFQRVYSGLFHAILGITLASTLMIIPWDFNYLSWGTLGCVLLCVLGIGVGYGMCALERKYKKEV